MRYDTEFSNVDMSHVPLAHLFVDPDTARNLKRLEIFNEPCFGVWRNNMMEFEHKDRLKFELTDGTKMFRNFELEDFYMGEDDGIHTRGVYREDFTAPLYCQVIDFLREHNDIVIELHRGGIPGKYHLFTSGPSEFMGLESGYSYNRDGSIREFDYYEGLKHGIDMAFSI
jgi:hypothetical protein